MLFNSYLFVLCFLPLTVLGYFGINRFCKTEKPALWWLFLMSLWFYGYADAVYLLLMLCSVGVNYSIAGFIGKNRKQDRKTTAKCWMSAGIIFNLGLLLYFKYYNFFVENLNAVFAKDWALRDLILPLGISFYTFKQISYVVDCYREKEVLEHSFIEYAVYVTFFPQLISGPIALYSEVIPGLREQSRKQINYENLSQGLYALALGLGKKVLLADNLAKIVNAGYGELEVLNKSSSIVIMIAYMLQIYFDFSGYCDMGIGASKMLNLDTPINFNSPYKARTVGEFWDRWHMTLGRFFTRYVYIPLGGSRRGRARTYINKLLVFLLSGFWHGANWTFVLWGMIHGAFSAIELFVQGLYSRIQKKWPQMAIGRGIRFLGTVAGRCYIFLFCNLTWILFRVTSIEEARTWYGRLTKEGGEISTAILEQVNDFVEVRLLYRLGLGGIISAHPWVPCVVILLGLVFAVECMKNTQEKMAEKKYGKIRSLVTVALIVWSVISMSSVSEFLYFNF